MPGSEVTVTGASVPSVAVGAKRLTRAVVKWARETLDSTHRSTFLPQDFLWRVTQHFLNLTEELTVFPSSLHYWGKIRLT